MHPADRSASPPPPDALAGLAGTDGSAGDGHEAAADPALAASSGATGAIGVAGTTGVTGVIGVTDAADATVQDPSRRDACRDEFLSMLAHELRNPLAPLTNALRLLQRADELGQRERSVLDMAARQVRQLTRLVDDLLEAARLTNGTIVLRAEPLDVAAVARGVAESLAPMLQAQRQQLRLALPDGPVHLSADRARLSQILENLLANASRFTPEGGHLELAVEPRADAVEIRVRDDGAGLPAEALERVFEPFVQVHATLDRARGGLGLGLALVRRLVELHGGRVTAASDGPGRGSCFTVRLPRRG